MKTKNLTAIILALELTSCTTINPKFELSYVPDNYVKPLNENLFFVSVGIEAKEKYKNLEFILGGDSGTYCDFSGELFPYINPLIQKYDIYGKLIIDNKYELFGQHFCYHPVIDPPVAAYDKQGLGYWVNQGSETRIGIRLKY